MSCRIDTGVDAGSAVQSMSARSTAANASIAESPANSRRPVSISKTHDAERPDVGALVGRPALCISGAMYGAVPRSMPARSLR